MVGTTELESVTSCMSSKRSNQLSYAPVNNGYHTKNSRACQAFCTVYERLFCRKMYFLHKCVRRGRKRACGSKLGEKMTCERERGMHGGRLLEKIELESRQSSLKTGASDLGNARARQLLAFAKTRRTADGHAGAKTDRLWGNTRPQSSGVS